MTAAPVLRDWFVVTQFRSGVVHAKVMGTTRTACDLDTQSWVKHWEVSFWAEGLVRCEDCVAVIRRQS